MPRALSLSGTEMRKTPARLSIGIFIAHCIAGLHDGWERSFSRHGRGCLAESPVDADGGWEGRALGTWCWR